MSMCSEAGFSSEEVLSLRFPLHRACRDGDLHCLTSLLQGPPGHTALQLGKEDSCYGWTPIHWAAHFGKLECLIQLVRAGCSVNACTTSFAQTPAHIAAFGGHPHCLLWLLQAGAYINKQDYVGETPVHKAARAGSMDCLKALVSNGAQIDFRNASDLTAADLAHSQGFRECAQFLLNLQNRHLNGLYLGGSISGAPPNIPSSHFNGGNNRKRSFNELEISSVKKPRTEVNGFGAVHPPSVPGYAEEENMHVENHSVELSDLNGSSPFSILTNGHAINKSTAQLGEMEMSPTKCLASPKGFTNGTMTNGKMEHEHGDAMENQAGAVNTLCGSFNVSGSPTEWVAHSPSWGDGVSDCLLYGHYHGFGDTAESLPELSSMVEHSNSVKVEYKYNSTFISTLHQYQGF